MTDQIPLRYAQKLLSLAPMSPEELRSDLTELNLPLVLMEKHSKSQAQISVQDYGRLFMHLVSAYNRLLRSAAKKTPRWCFPPTG